MENEAACVSCDCEKSRPFDYRGLPVDVAERIVVRFARDLCDRRRSELRDAIIEAIWLRERSMTR